RRAQTIEADTMIAEDVLLGLPAILQAAQVAFAATGGLHGAGMFTLEGALLAVREDVGRHNALDKLIGWALDAGLDPARHAIALSGRLGYELVQKTIRFGAPILVAVSAPSSLAIELGERFGVCIAGFVRPPRATLYAHAWRVRRSSWR
ncbi:MAG: formate dehydrogenase accessory sulfurtransferase FdhD, partial [Proteobacteria bacterium]|nr:formate dehydrogenase accessory sulfurtransferase FdhD [Pseudomonadota bacterium]